MKKFDVAVIGAGSIGVRAARLAAANGARVLLLDATSNAKKIGYDESLGRKLFVEAALRQKATWTSVKRIVAVEAARSLAGDTAETLREQGIETMFGAITVNEDISVTIGPEKIAAKKILIATPAMPKMPVSMGCKKDMVVTTAGLPGLSSKPRSVVVIGAGISGVETAHALANLGVSVHLVDHNSRILKHIDEEAASVITENLISRGVKIYTSASIPKITSVKGGKSVTISRYHNLAQVKVSQVVLATGPAMRTVKGLKKLVHIEEGTYQVDLQWRTSNPRIYAITDNTDRVCGYGQSGLPVVSAVSHAVLGKVVKNNFDVPYAVRTTPEVASVGPVESLLTREGISYESLRYTYGDLGMAGTSGGFIKLLVDKKRRIMAATIVGPEAGASIGYFAHMAADGDTLDDLRELLIPGDTLVGRVAQQIPLLAASPPNPVARFFMTFAKK